MWKMLAFQPQLVTRKLLEAKNAPQIAIVYKKAELVIQHHLYTKTYDKENLLLWKKLIRRDNSSKM